MGDMVPPGSNWARLTNPVLVNLLLVRAKREMLRRAEKVATLSIARPYSFLVDLLKMQLHAMHMNNEYILALKDQNEQFKHIVQAISQRIETIYLTICWSIEIQLLQASPILQEYTQETEEKLEKDNNDKRTLSNYLFLLAPSYIPHQNLNTRL